MDQNKTASHQHNLFQLFFNNSTTISCVFRADGSIQLGNKAFKEAFGNSDEADKPVHLKDLVRFESKTKASQIFQQLAAEQSSQITEVLICKSKTDVSMHLQWSFTTTEQADMILATATDISKYWMSGQMLKESQRIFNEFIQHSHALIFFCDKYSKIRKVNKEVLSNFGYSEDFLLGKDFSYFIYVEDKLLFSELLDQLVHNQVFSNTIRMIDAANNIRYIKLRLLKSYTVNNKSEITINAIDVTDLIELDKEVQKYRYFEELSEFKHEFLSNISNELRSPMNSIMGFNDILLHTDPNPQQIDSMMAVKNASRTLMTVIRDIIDFTAVKTGEMRIKSNHFNLKEVLDRVRNVSQAHAIHKDLKFTFEFPKHLPDYVLGDNVRFSQVLLNIIGNALNITEKGYVSVVVDQIDSGRQEFCSLLVNIEYAGTIRRKIQSNLVFKSEQSSDVDNDFGFSSTKGLIELLGGNLYYDNPSPDKSSFDIRLSFKIGEKPNESSQHSLSSLEGVKILLVEDSLLNQKLAKKLLQKLNADITLANNGQIALNYLQQERFDIILLDLQMPVMDGFTTIRNIRQELRLDTPVIAVTGLSQHDEKQRCLNAGMNDYLSKPFKKEDLFRKLFKFLNA